jgi:hypothetical protein
VPSNSYNILAQSKYFFTVVFLLFLEAKINVHIVAKSLCIFSTKLLTKPLKRVLSFVEPSFILEVVLAFKLILDPRNISINLSI